MTYQQSALGGVALIALLLLIRPGRLLLAWSIRQSLRFFRQMCAAFSAAFDQVLRPSTYDGGVAASRWLLWLLMNALAAAAGYHLVVRGQPMAGVALAAGHAGIHLLLLAGAVLKIAEDNRIMQLGTPRGGPMFAPRAAVACLPAIAASAMLVVLTCAILTERIAGLGSGVLGVRGAATGHSLLDHGLAIVSELPLGSGLLSLVLSTEIAFAGTFGGVARNIVSSVGQTLLLGAIVAWYQQRTLLADLLAQFEHAEGEDAQFIQRVAGRAPPIVKAGLLALALDAKKPRAQIRAINTMRHVRMFTFPHAFLAAMSSFTSNAQAAGLRQIGEFLADDAKSFDAVLLIHGLHRALSAHVRLAKDKTDGATSAIRDRLGSIAASYAGELVRRKARIVVNGREYGALLALAKSHPSMEVRREIAAVLKGIGHKGFLMSYLADLGRHRFVAADRDIIDGFAELVGRDGSNWSKAERQTILRRLRWSIRNANLPGDLIDQLRAIESAMSS